LVLPKLGLRAQRGCGPTSRRIAVNRQPHRWRIARRHDFGNTSRLRGMAPRPWTLVETRVVQDCRIFRVERAMTRAPDGGGPHPFWRLVADDWVNVVPVTADDRIVMVRQWRHGAREVTLEI